MIDGHDLTELRSAAEDCRKSAEWLDQAAGIFEQTPEGADPDETEIGARLHHAITTLDAALMRMRHAYLWLDRKASEEDA